MTVPFDHSFLLLKIARETYFWKAQNNLEAFGIDGGQKKVLRLLPIGPHVEIIKITSPLQFLLQLSIKVN